MEDFRWLTDVIVTELLLVATFGAPAIPILLIVAVLARRHGAREDDPAPKRGG